MNVVLLRCRKCGETAKTPVELAKFVRNKSSTFGRMNICYNCSRKMQRDKYKRVKEAMLRGALASRALLTVNQDVIEEWLNK